ncbi:unnamed protein product [Orchesella dallaii]|uniref:Integral membrane protein DGCR2/IDD n=1 Tax=Orchesella dallaii TaxID=48710 RepID=A0ABP1RYF4_9HEXA
MDQTFQNDCIDFDQKVIPNGTDFIQGPDNCTFCTCDEWEPKWCKAELCSPPLGCKSFKIGNSCCDFICLDESVSLNKMDSNGEGPYMPHTHVAIEYSILISVFATAVIMVALFLILYREYRAQQRLAQGQHNSEHRE